MKTRTLLQQLALALPLPLLASRAGAQVTIHVPADFPTIQGAFTAASSGDTILVAAGTYDENIRALGKTVRVVSAEGPESTAIDANGHGRVFDIRGGSVTLEGFRIQNGGGYGGGIYLDAYSPVIRNCIIESCQGVSGSHGGGMFVQSGNPRVEGCTFRFNRAGTGQQGPTGASGQNGGLFSPPTNGGVGATGGIGGFGGAVYVDLGSAPLFVNCFFHDNQSGQGGRGGTGGRGGNGILLQNGANGGRGGQGGMGGVGGAVFVTPGSPARFVNCTFVNNHLGGPGGGGAGGAGGTGGAGASNGSTGPAGSGGDPGWGGGGLYVYVQPRAPLVGELQNSIVWSNDLPQISGVLVSHSDVQGGSSGPGNVDADPLLSGASLLAGSPCIDAGNDGWLPAGTTTDLQGYPRRFDDPLVTSLVPGSRVDMGCAEFLAGFALPYGCGPAGSLRMLFSGAPAPGSTLRFMVRDDDARLGARAALLVGTARDPAPCGTPTNGGRLLVDLAQPYSLVLGDGVGPQILSLHLPADPALLGQSFFVQGATIAPQAARPSQRPLTWSLLEAMQVVVGP